MNQIATFLYLATLALLPWGAIVPFPWLHENAQWSDALFALAALAWAAGIVVSRRWPRLRLVHAGLGLYLGWAALSLLAADPRPVSGPSKLLGVGMLVALMVVTSEIARRSGMPRAIGCGVRRPAFPTRTFSPATASSPRVSWPGLAPGSRAGCRDWPRRRSPSRYCSPSRAPSWALLSPPPSAGRRPRLVAGGPGAWPRSSSWG